MDAYKWERNEDDKTYDVEGMKILIGIQIRDAVS